MPIIFMLVSSFLLVYDLNYVPDFSLKCTLLSLLPLLTITQEMAFIGALNSNYALHNLLNEYCIILFVLMVLHNHTKQNDKMSDYLLTLAIF